MKIAGQPGKPVKQAFFEDVDIVDYVDIYDESVSNPYRLGTFWQRNIHIKMYHLGNIKMWIMWTITSQEGFHRLLLYLRPP